MPLVQTRGAASAQGFGEFAQAATAVNYIEDVFSTYLYTGTGAAQTITNGIDLSTKGGLVWLKGRDYAQSHGWFDSARTNGLTQYIQSDRTTAQQSDGTPNPGITLNTTGFTRNAGSYFGGAGDGSGSTYVSWTFRKQPKFFDVVTYTGNGSTQNIAHNLGSVPGCIIVKRLNNASNTGWPVYHRYDYQQHGFLNLDNGFTGAQEETWFGNNVISVAPTSTVFTVGNNQDINANTNTYVAYIFAHNAGGFGLTGTDNVISCGSFTTNGSGVATVSLGYEPQWILAKPSSTTGGWLMYDSMRGFTNGGASNEWQELVANSSGAESAAGVPNGGPTATGFITGGFQSSVTYVYIAIRRGPMKVPTSGTSVFGLSARTGTGANATVTGGQTDDAVLIKNRGSAVASLFSSRLTGTGYLVTSSTAAEVAAGTTILQANPWDVMDGVKVGTTSTITNASSNTFINYLFKRAPSFFDEVCYTGTGSATTFSHNLGIVPEMMIVKGRSGTTAWQVYASALANTEYVVLNTTAAKATGATRWNSTTPTTSVFSIGTATEVNTSAATYVAYLFATCAGVSKVGSYTGTATTKQIDCGFTSGARFVLIKRMDTTGDWYVWDTARGIVSGNDPYILLNSTAAEVTNTDYIDTYSAGFELSSTAPAALNASGGTYIFLAIA